MDLKDFKIIPGVVIEVNDPKYIGRVKADAPGLFNSEVMSKEGLPWIYPASMNGYQRFSKLINGSKIWILTNFDYTEFWYWPMFELNQDTKNIISANESDYNESEVLLSRNMGDNSVYIYYSPSQGIMIKQGENCFINLTADNKLILKCGDGQVMIQNNEVYIGDTNTESMQKAILGDDLVKYLGNFKIALENLAAEANFGYTAPIASSIKACADALSNPEKLLAKNTKID